MKSTWKKLLLSAGLLVVMGLTASRVKAVGTTEINLDHNDGRIRKTDNGVDKTPAGFRLTDNPTIEVWKGNKVVVSIINANPLLFDYTLKKGAATKTANQAALEQFADTALAPFLAKIGELGGGLSVKTGDPKPPGLCLDEIPKLKEMAKASIDINSAAKDRKRIAKLSFLDPAKAKGATAEWKLEEWAKTTSAAKESLTDVDSQIAQGTADPTETACAGMIGSALREISRIEETLPEMEKFQKLAEEIGKPIVIDPFNVNIAEDQPIEVRVTKSKIFPKDLQSERFLGEGKFTISPESRARILTIAPALVYSFVRDPSFEAKASGSQFIIQKKENPYKKLDVAAMMQLEPNAWDLGSVNLGVQLGASPQTNLGLFLGLSLRAADLFTFGAGIAYQRVDRLKEGLSVGQALATQDLLKTEKTFETGLYLHITVTPRKKS